MDMSSCPSARPSSTAHLAVDTDTVCATRVAYAVSARTAVPVLPALPYAARSATRAAARHALAPAETLIAVVAETLGWAHASASAAC